MIEFPRPYRLDMLGSGAMATSIAAEANEREALAKRFDLVAIERLEAQASLSRVGPVVSASGTLRAEVVQACVVTDDRLPVTIEQAFELRFVPELDAAPDEVELDPDECDTMFYDGGAVDLGEAVAETLALALDPYPRSPRADAVLKEAGVISEDEHAPVSALAGLKDLLNKG